MNFSIKFLFALLVLGALFANYFVLHQSRQQLLSEHADVLAESDLLTYKEREAVGFSPLYQTGIEGERQLNSKYLAALEASKDLPYLVSELTIEDASKISYRNLPLLEEGKLHHFAFRIHVPQNKPIFLSTAFENSEDAFVSPEDHSIQLTPGKHIVDYRYDYEDGKLLELFIDGEKIFSTATRGRQTGYSLWGTP